MTSLRRQRTGDGHQIARKQRQAGGRVGVVELEMKAHKSWLKMIKNFSMRAKMAPKGAIFNYPKGALSFLDEGLFAFIFNRGQQHNDE